MVNKFKKWLDKEVEDTRPLGMRHCYTPGCFSEALRIRAHFEIMAKEYREEMEHAAVLMCDHFCRWPIAYPEEEHEKMIGERCDICPLNKILEEVTD